MATGCTIISSMLPFNYDVLNPRNSILVDPLDIKEIEQAIISLKYNSELKKYLSANALSDSKQFHIDKRADKILRFMYEEANIN